MQGKRFTDMDVKAIDVLVCVDDGGESFWTVGKEYTVNHAGKIVDNDGAERYFPRAAFVPKEELGVHKKFKVGDVVRRITVGSFPERFGKVGDEYTVLGVSDYGDIEVINGEAYADHTCFELVSRANSGPRCLKDLDLKKGDVVEWGGKKYIAFEEPKPQFAGDVWAGTVVKGWLDGEAYDTFTIRRAPTATPTKADNLASTFDAIVAQYTDTINMHLEEGNTSKAADTFLELRGFTHSCATE